MASEKVGALIVLPKHLNIEGYADSGQIINAEITEELIRSIFQKNSPLHDGAMIIYGGKIHAASCVLPISSNPDLHSGLGLRHRAGLGSSENSDTVSFIVSEETGDISVAVKGKLQRGLSKKMLLTILDEHYN
jgi:DNA integrity scanning protein DisA with diadenylate cyclase activity